MWEWRVWLPLSKETPADVTALLGADIEVGQSDELHYKVADTSVDLRRVHVKTQKHARAWEGNGSKGESLMLLRVRRGLKWTTCIERWVAISKLSLRDEDFLTEELDDRVMAWLTRNGVSLEHRPQTVAIRRRTLIASLPDERRLSHLLLEQSDLEANGRMWRSVCVRGSSPEQVHRYVLSLREHLLSGYDKSVPPPSERANNYSRAGVDVAMQLRFFKVESVMAADGRMTLKVWMRLR